jgi:hypothetical protein
VDHLGSVSEGSPRVHTVAVGGNSVLSRSRRMIFISHFLVFPFFFWPLSLQSIAAVSRF